MPTFLESACVQQFHERACVLRASFRYAEELRGVILLSVSGIYCVCCNNGEEIENEGITTITSR